MNKQIIEAIKNAIVNGNCEIAMDSYEFKGFKMSLGGNGVKEKLKLAAAGKFKYSIESMTFTGLSIDMSGDIDEQKTETTIEE